MQYTWYSTYVSSTFSSFLQELDTRDAGRSLYEALLYVHPLPDVLPLQLDLLSEWVSLILGVERQSARERDYPA